MPNNIIRNFAPRKQYLWVYVIFRMFVGPTGNELKDTSQLDNSPLKLQSHPIPHYYFLEGSGAVILQKKKSQS
jgi:hypothetical protein